MTDICCHFVQNAWKKDLCSNCFKSKDEHNVMTNGVGGEENKNHYVSAVYPTRGYPWKQNGTEVQSILKSLKDNEPKRKRSIVHFPPEESEVIGYGGDEFFFSDEEDSTEPVEDGSVSEEDTNCSEKDLEVQRITKNNTDYNMRITNSSDKFVGPLKLGSTVLDTEGKRKTLQVSVTPFGEKMNGDSLPISGTKKNGINKCLTESAKITFTRNQSEKCDTEAEWPKLENKNNMMNGVVKSEISTEKMVNGNHMESSKDNNANIITPIKCVNANINLIVDSPKRSVCEETTDEKIHSKKVTEQLDSKDSSSESELTSESDSDKEVKDMENKRVTNELKVTLSTNEGNDTKVSRIPVNKLRFSTEKSKDTSLLNGTIESSSPKTETVEQVSPKSPLLNGTPENDSPKPITRRSVDNTKIPSLATVQSCIHQKSEENNGKDAAVKDVNNHAVDKAEQIPTPAEQKVKECKMEYNKTKLSKKNSDSKDDKLCLRKESNDIDICSRSSGSYSLIPNTVTNESCVLTKCVDISEFSINNDKCDSNSQVKESVIKQESNEEHVWCHSGKSNADEMFHVEDSRELAGEPDGRADPPPALDPLPSFLHGSLNSCSKLFGAEKPKIPMKPDKVLRAATKRPPALSFQAPTPPCLPDQAETDSRIPQKRQAPKPPTSPSEESTPLSFKSGSATQSRYTPHRGSSVSVENLPSEIHSLGEHEKKKSSGRRFCLRKLLRFGGHRDGRSSSSSDVHCLDSSSSMPVVTRPKLEIIHPIDLNGSVVQVVTGDGKQISRNSENGSSPTESVDTCGLSGGGSSCAARPNKPPPPPRNQSLGLESLNKPSRPPPPKTLEILHKQKHPPTSRVPVPSPTCNVYANLVSSSPGEVRSGLTPHKPQRTASLRDNNAKKPITVAQIDDTEGYEAVDLGNSSNSKTIEHENVYECVSSIDQGSSPESEKVLRYNSSWTANDSSSECLKSLPYCGSETESDIYSPYSFYGSEDYLPNGDDDSDWTSSISQLRRSSKLHLRKGRSVVHKSLEDNYGAVITANHEALANVLEQVNQIPLTPPLLRALKTSSNLCWNDFVISDEKRPVVAGRRVFHLAHWGTHPVTLCVALDQGLPSRGCFSLSPVVEFTDLISSQYVPVDLKPKTQLVQVFVAVLPKLNIDTIQSYACALRDKVQSSLEEQIKSGCFILLQLVNALKHLQAQGVEEMPLSLSSFVLCSDEQEQAPRLYVLQGIPHREDEGPVGSLCCCAVTALNELVPKSPITCLISGLLEQERAISLSRVKSVLEFSLWGPTDIVLESSVTSRELALRRWLDLERATMLQGLVRSRTGLNAFEECHLLYLVHTSAKNTCEASMLLDSCSKSEA